MNLFQILEKVYSRKLSPTEAEKIIKLNAVIELKEGVKLDIGREYRTGAPEIIFAEYKDNEMLRNIIREKIKHVDRIIVSRLRDDQLKLIDEFKDLGYKTSLNKLGKIAVIKRNDYKNIKNNGKIGIVTAGAADIPLAEEVKTIAEELGCETVVSYDAGISSLNRTLNAVQKMISNDVDVMVVIAGMEGALPSIVKSLVDIPVIGLPASKGYGIGGGGEAALLSMLQSCSAGLLVVNIDNSVGAALAAASIANRISKYKK